VWTLRFSGKKTFAFVVGRAWVSDVEKFSREKNISAGNRNSFENKSGYFYPLL
jgi:hypothetical protein